MQIITFCEAKKHMFSVIADKSTCKENVSFVNMKIQSKATMRHKT